MEGMNALAPTADPTRDDHGLTTDDVALVVREIVGSRIDTNASWQETVRRIASVARGRPFTSRCRYRVG